MHQSLRKQGNYNVITYPAANERQKKLKKKTPVMMKQLRQDRYPVMKERFNAIWLGMRPRGLIDSVEVIVSKSCMQKQPPPGDDKKKEKKEEEHRPLYRGCHRKEAQLIAEMVTAGGTAELSTMSSPSEKEAISYVSGMERSKDKVPKMEPTMLVEYSESIEIALQFAKGLKDEVTKDPDGAVVVILIDRSLTTMGSKAESGWLMYRGAKVKNAAYRLEGEKPPGAATKPQLSQMA